MNKSTLIISLTLVVILAISAYFAWSALKKAHEPDLSVSPAAQSLGTNASSTGYTDLQGNPIVLDGYIGTPIIAHSWASWAPDSPIALSHLSRLQEQYPNGELVVLAVNRAEPYNTALQFLRQINATSVTLVADEDDQYYKTIGGRTMPETVFYDIEGNIFRHERGMMTYAELEIFADRLVQASQ